MINTGLSGALTGTTTEYSGNVYDPSKDEEGVIAQGIGPTSYWDQLNAKGWLDYEQSFTASHFRKYEESQAREKSEKANEQKVKAADLMKKYGSISGVVINEDEYESVIDLRVNARKHELEVLDYISKGGSFGRGSAMLAGLYTNLDPVQMGANIGLGLVMATPPLAAVGAGLSTVKYFAMMAAVESGANLALDIPTYYQLKKEYSQVTIGETVLNSVIGGVIAGGLSTLGRTIKNSRALKAKKNITKVTEAAARDELNLPPEPPHGGSDHVDDLAKGLEKGGTPPDRAKIEDFNLEPLYSANDRQGRVTGGDFDGIVLSDSHSLANNLGAPVLSDLKGVKALELASDFTATVKKRIDDIKVDTPEGIEVKKMLTEVLGKKTQGVNTFKDFFDMLKADEAAGILEKGATAVSEFKSAVKKLGYNAVSQYIEEPNVPRHNVLELLDEAPLEDVATLKQDMTKIPQYDGQKTATAMIEEKKALQQKAFENIDTKEIAVLKEKDAPLKVVESLHAKAMEYTKSIADSVSKMADENVKKLFNTHIEASKKDIIKQRKKAALLQKVIDCAK